MEQFNFHNSNSDEYSFNEAYSPLLTHCKGSVVTNT